MSRAASNINKPLEFYQVMVTRPDGTQYSSIRSQPYGNDSIKVFGINPLETQAEKNKVFRAWLMLTQLAPVMPPLVHTGKGTLENRYEQLEAPIDVVITTLVYLGLPSVVASERFFQAANFAAIKTRPSLFANNENSDFQKDLSQVLLDAALNADLSIVKNILENLPEQQRKKILSIRRTATTQLGRISVERTGTPLQMAIYDHDEEMAGYLASQMDSSEFEQQSKEAFATALSPEKRAELEKQNTPVLDYHKAMLEEQKKDADTLCAGLEDIFKATHTNQFSIDAKYVANTTSEKLKAAVNAFIERLANYVKRNHAHNPYILQLMYEIYHRSPPDRGRNCYFSQKVLGGVQSLLPACWLQHFAQGVNQLTAEPERYFASYDIRSRLVDIRHLISSSVSVDSFLSVLRPRYGCHASNLLQLLNLKLADVNLGKVYYKTHVEKKQKTWGNLYDNLRTNPRATAGDVPLKK